MKIGLDVTGRKALEQYASVPETPSFSKTEKIGAARLDITGMYTDVNAYAVHGRTTEDLKKEAASIDVATVRDYMTVMSNTMSGEDYKKAMEDGFDMSEMDPAKSETILDHIKVVMAESGQVVAGFNDDLNSDVVRDIAGRDIDLESVKEELKKADLPETPENIKGISEAVAMMQTIDNLTDGSIKYMVENDLEPTIGNIYTSSFSASGDGSRQARGYYSQDMNGYLAKKADDIDWESLLPQVEKTARTMNIEDSTDEQKLSDARWLLEKGIPITEDKLQNYTDIKAISFPISAKTVVSASIEAIAEGRTPREANLLPRHKGVFEKAYRQQSRILESAIGREEARLTLSLDVNVRLVKQGISLDTESIEESIKVLKEEEKKLFAEFFETEDKEAAGTDTKGQITDIDRKIELFEATSKAVREIPAMPASLIAHIPDEQGISLRRVHSIGTQLKERFEAAVQTYEAVGTEVRKDLGDSITKAFRNVDDILKDLGLNLSEENRRAVRILGYNNMVINDEEIRKVKYADSKLNSVIKALTPGKTLQLIREGVNPLDMDMDELVAHINELDHDPKREAEKYSKFLYKLEKSGGITEKERTSYIGIYRMINKIERSDHAAIGRMIESETDMTFGKLLTLMRSSGRSIDAGIDDSFGFLSKSVTAGVSITDQIVSAFADQITERAYETLEWEQLKESEQEVRDSARADDAVYESLLDDMADITPNNVIAEEQFIQMPNYLFRSLRTYASRTDRKLGTNVSTLEKSLADAADDLADGLDDRDSAKQSYREFTETMTETLRQMVDNTADTLVDLKSINLMHKQITLATAAAESESYHIPVMIGGRPTDIRLKLKHGDETGLVSATVDSEVFGRVQAQIRVKGESVEAVFIGENRSVEADLKPVADSLNVRLQEIGYSDTKMRFITGDPLKGVKHTAGDADNNIEAVDTAKLYKIAKQFIFSIRDKEE